LCPIYKPFSISDALIFCHCSLLYFFFSVGVVLKGGRLRTDLPAV
jgi:hypothetical protein